MGKFQRILVYNVTHSDLLFGYNEENTMQCCKPKFSFVQTLGDMALSRLLANEGKLNVKFSPVIGGDVKEIAVGLEFPLNDPILILWNSLHLRSNRMPPTINSNAQLNNVYIPLAAQLIPEWIKRGEMYAETPQNHILLLCGAGKPQDQNSSPTGNSTVNSARIIQHFFQSYLDSTTIIKVVESNQTIDLFDFLQNVSFLRTELVPIMDEIRRSAASGIERWRDLLDVTIALTEGSPARLQALTLCLHPYSPNFAHLRQVKSFWHDHVIFHNDIDFRQRVEELPAISIKQISLTFQNTIEEIKHYRDDFIENKSGDSELLSFWLRKSQRRVLSVLAVQEDTKVVYYRGINLEVSQPTGSLCSERNAIGSALAANPNLNRKNVLAVAVLSLERVGDEISSKRVRNNSIINEIDTARNQLNPLGPCGACQEWLKKISEVNPDFKVLTFTNLSCDYTFIQEVL
jgi:cytidine deaminase